MMKSFFGNGTRYQETQLSAEKTDFFSDNHTHAVHMETGGVCK